MLSRVRVCRPAYAVSNRLFGVFMRPIPLAAKLHLAVVASYLAKKQMP